MNKYKRVFSGLMIMLFLTVISLSTTPVYAFSISDLLGQTTQSVNGGGVSGLSTGQGLLNILLGLIVGKYLINTSSSSPADGVNKSVSNESAGSTRKELVGFYAEWWGGRYIFL